eukprot:COSAG02_NODE_8459_length_2564_cov_2.330495_4_plen_106_part_00
MGNVLRAIWPSRQLPQTRGETGSGLEPDLPVDIYAGNQRSAHFDGRENTHNNDYNDYPTSFHRNCTASSVAVMLDSRSCPLSNEHVGSLFGFLTDFIHWSAVIDV